jgi:hypothetical protein
MGVDRPGGMDILTNPDDSGMNYLGDSPRSRAAGAGPWVRGLHGGPPRQIGNLRGADESAMKFFGGEPRSPLLFVILFVNGGSRRAPAATRLDGNGRPLGVPDNGRPLGALLGLLLSSGACPPAPAFRPPFAFPLTASQPASPHFLQEYPRFEECRTNL